MKAKNKLKEFATEYLNSGVGYSLKKGAYGDSGLAIVSPHPSDENTTLFIEYYDDPERTDSLGDFEWVIGLENDLDEKIYDEYPFLDSYFVMVYLAETDPNVPSREKIIINSMLQVGDDPSHIQEQMSDESDFFQDYLINGQSVEDIWF